MLPWQVIGEKMTMDMFNPIWSFCATLDDIEYKARIAKLITYSMHVFALSLA